MKKSVLLVLILAMIIGVFAACSPAEEDSDLPTLTYLYNTDDSHKAIGEYLQAALQNAGFTMNLQNQEWNTFLETRKNGDYSVARNGWVADYNDPISFLDMWTSQSGNNDVQFGKGSHATLKMYDLDLTAYGYEVNVTNGTWAETYDVLMEKIKSCTDNTKRYAMMHIAEDMLMDTGCIVPLYYYTDLYMIDDTVTGFYSNPLGYKYFMNTKVNGKTDVLNVCLASEPQTLDPALNSAVDGATMLAHMFSGLAKWDLNEKGELIISPDAVTELVEGVVGEDGKVTYTYTLKDNLKWSNGDPLTAGDFVASWKRASSTALGADYGYMFEVIDGYADDNLNVKATDDKTLVVTLSNAVSYWNELLAFPTYFPVHSSNLQSEDWATKPATYICNGPYIMESWDHNSNIVLKKNPNYHDADSVTMNSIKCFLSDDSNSMLANFNNGSWQFIDDVPTAEIANLKKNPEFVIAGQIGTYYVCWNINLDLLPASDLTGVEKEAAQAEIRRAIGLLFDRNYIVENVSQAGELPASSFVAMGISDADGKEFYKNACSTTDSFDGYFDVSADALEGNYTKAMEVLKKYYKSLAD